MDSIEKEKIIGTISLAEIQHRIDMAKLETAQKIFKDLDAFGKITQDKGAGELFVIFLDEYTRIKNKHLK